MLERVPAKTLKKWLIVVAILYFLLPYDLLSDFMGLPGRVDDIALMAGLAWFYWKQQRRRAVSGEAQESTAGGSDQRRSGASPQSERFDPHEVLGVSASASSETIRSAYRARMKEYHPDKVAHLGEELQKLAHEKSQQFQRAYRQLQS